MRVSVLETTLKSTQPRFATRLVTLYISISIIFLGYIFYGHIFWHILNPFELPPRRPFVVTFLKMSAKSSDFSAEAEDANEIIMSLVCSEVATFDVLEAMVKKVKSSSLSALKEALKSELPIAYGGMEESREAIQ